MDPTRRTPPPADHSPQRMPVPDESGRRLVIDPYWGTIGKLRPHPDVELFGELELIAHLDAGATAIDVRLPALARLGTIPGAISIPAALLAAQPERFTDAKVVVLFCIGPLCPASSNAIMRLIDAGVPAERIGYYRAGVAGWVSLALPLCAPLDDDA